MSTVLNRLVSDGLNPVGAVTNAAVVAATIYVIDGSLGYAVAVAAGFLALHLATDIAEAVVGEYAGNALFGLLILFAAGYVTTLTAPLWLLVGGAAVGGWFLLDGVQHLRHGASREEVGVPYRHDGSVLTGLPTALLARLLAPFRL
ncbi:hypothetical protein [Haloarcula onubensis]|uniref:Uncharacterized protein n=1 Tax=Haloarcula onubensis TaxID=2950539 RepID=A0ABU2FMH4_9EURY|nr:hypothetical protein [Halomicroarcula sp. S3CR25-11]MDS0281965.1 hypothetical protein [Halomicroarcula sp. S3CR25-11]